MHRRRRRGVGGSGCPLGLENFRANSVFRASATCSEILNDKKYLNSVKNSRATVFQCKRELLKSWAIKNTYSVQWIQGPSGFQGKRKLLKNPKCKKYIQYSEKFQGNSVFQGKPELLKKILNDEIYFNTVNIFRAPSVFQGKRNLLTNPECKKYIQYSENFQGKRELLKSWMIKSIFNTVKIFRGSASCSNNRNVISILKTVKIFRATLFFRESASCSKILNDKCIFNTVNSGQLCFSGQAQVAQKSWIIKNTFSIQWKIAGQA